MEISKLDVAISIAGSWSKHRSGVPLICHRSGWVFIGTCADHSFDTIGNTQRDDDRIE